MRQPCVDNGPELVSAQLVAWCEANQVVLHHIQPRKPTQDAYIERWPALSSAALRAACGRLSRFARINRTFRAEVLDAHLFHSLSEVRDHVHEWMLTYNHERPHDALRNLPPICKLPLL